MPDCVYKMGNLRIVDLTKVLDPKTESRRCHLIRYNTGGPIPDFHTALDLTSHLGTHCECPYHHFEDGVLFTNCKAVQDMKADFEHCFPLCMEVTKKYKKTRNLLQRGWNSILRLFSSLL